MSDAYDVYPGERIVAGVFIKDPELYFSTEEANLELFLILPKHVRMK